MQRRRRGERLELLWSSSSSSTPFSWVCYPALSELEGELIIFPFLVLYMRHNAQKAAGANALIVTISSLVGSVGHGIVGHLDLLIATAVAAVIGAAVGSQVTAKSSSRFINAAFGALIWAFAIEIALSLLHSN